MKIGGGLWDMQEVCHCAEARRNSSLIPFRSSHENHVPAELSVSVYGGILSVHPQVHLCRIHAGVYAPCWICLCQFCVFSYCWNKSSGSVPVLVHSCTLVKWDLLKGGPRICFDNLPCAPERCTNFFIHYSFRAICSPQYTSAYPSETLVNQGNSMILSVTKCCLELCILNCG